MYCRKEACITFIQVRMFIPFQLFYVNKRVISKNYNQYMLNFIFIFMSNQLGIKFLS